jgi:hypothetical protein
MSDDKVIGVFCVFRAPFNRIKFRQTALKFSDGLEEIKKCVISDFGSDN